MCQTCALLRPWDDCCPYAGPDPRPAPAGPHDPTGSGTAGVRPAGREAGALSYSTGSNTESWSVARIAGYLTDGYWAETGRERRSFDLSPGESITVQLSGLTQEGRFLATTALTGWSMALGIGFLETADDAQIVFDDNRSGAFSSSVTLDNTIRSSRVNVSTDWLASHGVTVDSYSYQTYLHEIGHAIGLGHSGPYNGSASYGRHNAYANDSWQMSLMSYFSQTENHTVAASYGFAITPMIADILAAQDLYGRAGTLRGGDDVYGFNSTAGGVYDQVVALSRPVTFTIVDDGGTDTFDASGSPAAQMIDLRPGQVSDVFGFQGNMVIALGTLIENAIGGDGPDSLRGNLAANHLVGGDGDDRLHGGAAGDWLVGGAGRDYLRGGSGEDRLEGGPGRDILRGGAGNDRLIGGDGNDLLKGGWGDDILTGGPGRDVFRFKPGFGNDVITDFEDGIDLIRIINGADSMDDLLVTALGDDTLVAFVDVTILLRDIAPGSIGSEDFIFG